MTDSSNDTLQAVSNYIAKLNDMSAVAIAGEDAEEFLSNQLSSDVRTINPGQLQHSAWCDPKGRVLFYLLLAKTDTSFYCFVTKGLAEQFCKRLSMFVLRAAVTIEHLDKHCVLGVSTTNQTSPQSNEVFYFPNKPSPAPIRYLSLTQAAETQITVDNLELPEYPGQWQYDDIVLGHPYLSPEASGAFLPQNLNLDALDGISFTKGCYPGQEIVARLKYRGKVKQRLAILRAESDAEIEQAIPPMTTIFSTDKQHQKIGTTLIAQKVGRDLAVSAVVEAELLQNAADARIEGFEAIFKISPPPYDIEF